MNGLSEKDHRRKSYRFISPSSVKEDKDAQKNKKDAQSREAKTFGKIIFCLKNKYMITI